MYHWKKLAIYAALFLLIGSSIIGATAKIGGGGSRPLRLVAYTPMESMQAASPALIHQDLLLVKQLGFDGVKLWDTTTLYEKGWLDEVLTEAERLDLKVNVVFQFENNQDSFPPSLHAREVMNRTAIGIGSITFTHQAVVWNSLFAPFDWNMSEPARQKIVQSSSYQSALEESLRMIKAADHVHEARISLDFDPSIGFPLLRNADGYGIMPYDLRQDKFDPQRVLQFIGYFASDKKPVYIDEWGLHTTHTLSHGVASNENAKAKLLLDFAKFGEEMDLDWTYFMLVDRVSSIPFENGADWGLVNMDRSPRQSGILLEKFFLVS